MTLKCLLLENINPSAIQAFQKAGFEVDHLTESLQGQNLINKLKDYQILGIRSKTKLTRDVLSQSTHLKAIGCFCIGSDQVDLRTAQNLGIPVFNSPYMNTRSVAELVISHIIGLARKVPEHIKNMSNNKWVKSHRKCYEIRNKTLGIIGYGHVGIQVSQLAESFGMKVLYYDIEPKLPFGISQGVTLEELLKESDFVSLHVPGNQSTKNMISKDQLDLMKPGSYLINLSRGSVVDLETLKEALESKHLAGAALDVYPVEPSKSNSEFEIPFELHKIPNIYLTPHIGGATEEAQKEIGLDVSSKLIDFITFGQTKFALNLPEIISTRVPLQKNQFRVSLIHYNRPGFMAKMTQLLQEYDVNVEGQLLSTYSQLGTEVGYLLLRCSFITDQGNQNLLKDLAQIGDLIRFNRHPICHD